MHYGLSLDGLIEGNRIVSNEVFFGMIIPGSGDGGGIFIGSQLDAEDPGEAAAGSGSVTINAKPALSAVRAFVCKAAPWVPA